MSLILLNGGGGEGALAAAAIEAAASRQCLAAFSPMGAGRQSGPVQGKGVAHGQDEGQQRAAYASIGQLVTWVFIPLLSIASLLAYERSSGLLSRILTTLTSRTTYFLGTLCGQVLLALVQMALLIGFGALVMGVAWGRAPGELAAVLVAFALAAAGLGTLLGTVVKTAAQASNVAILAGMLFALLGGAWVPSQVFPPALDIGSRLLPTRWAMEALTDLVIRGQGWPDILAEVAALLGFFLLFLFLATLRFGAGEAPWSGSLAD